MYSEVYMNFKKALALLLTFAVALLALLSFTACFAPEKPDDNEPAGPQPEPTYPEDDLPLDGLVLIRKNVAQFKVVIAGGAGSAGRRAANNLVATLKSLGVEISDAIEDKDAAAVSDCEIIIGTGVRNRPDACVVTADYLGEDGYTVKVVGKRVIIAGGTTNLTRDTVNDFVKNNLGITDSTTALRNKSISETLKVEVLTKYELDSLKIGAFDISEFSIVCDQNDDLVYSMATDLRTDIRNLTGKKLPFVDERDSDNISHKIVLRTIPFSVDSQGKRTYDDGFYAYYKDGSLYIECEYTNAFLDSYEQFFKEYFSSKDGNVVIPVTLDYSEHVSTVSYCVYGGAAGDGVTNDFLAILKTHRYANKGGQKVIADPGKVFYIGETGGAEIPVMTDCDFGTQVHLAGEKDAFGVDTDDPKLYMDEPNFIIDDTIPTIYSYSGNPIFKIARDDPAFSLTIAQLMEIGLVEKTYTDIDGVEKTVYAKPDNSVIVGEGDTSIPWITNFTGGKRAMISLHNTKHRDFIRFGANQNSGNVRRDIVIVDEDGNIDESTPVVFDFTEISSINIIPIDDTPITINGGHFKTIANQALEVVTHWLNGEQVTYNDYRNVYHSYGRGFKISRANVTLTNIRHKMEGEVNPIDSSTGNYATTGCGYPYYGFFFFDTANSVDVINCDLTGHVVYYEDKSQFSNSSGTASSSVAMGTYDFVVEYSNDISFDGLEMRGTDIGDGKYWGIMSSNGCKNLHFNNCVISRIDAHRGFWNVKIENTTIGQLFNVVGGGTLEVINTQRRVGDRFLRLRGDYGSSFEGDIILKNCLLDGFKSYNSAKGGSREKVRSVQTGYIIYVDAVDDAKKAKNENKVLDPTVYYKWDFGYDCYLPTTVTIENFVSRVTGSTYIFNGVQNGHFNTPGDESPYVITQKINLIANSQNLPTFLKKNENEECDTHNLLTAPSGSDYSLIRGVEVEKISK